MIPMPKVPVPIKMRADPDLNFLSDQKLQEKKQWRLMMDYFKKNPNALMDAIPTPPNEKAEAQGGMQKLVLEFKKEENEL